MSKGNKVYGLILPKKQAQVKSQSSAVSNVFGNDSDEDERSSGPIAPYKVATNSSKMKRQTQMDIDKALQEDPNIYEYDEVYDAMQANKPQVGKKENEKSKKDRKPKYIAGLLKAAEVKKKDDERRLERKVQKEREAEGEKYADKEKFVTSAYKQKMLEMQAEEERERREAAFEEMTDVTKQKDMSGFYRYLYRQTGGTDVPVDPSKSEPTEKENDVKKEPESPSSSPPHAPVRRSSRSSSVSSSSSGSQSSASDRNKESRSKNAPSKKQTRHDSSSSNDSDSEKETNPTSVSKKMRRSRSASPHVNKEDMSDHRKVGKNNSKDRNYRSNNRHSPNRSGRDKDSSPPQSDRHKSSRSPKDKSSKGRSASPQNGYGRKRSPSPKHKDKPRSSSPEASFENERRSKSSKRSQVKESNSLKPSQDENDGSKSGRKRHRSPSTGEQHSEESDHETTFEFAKPQINNAVDQKLKGLRESSQNETVRAAEDKNSSKTEISKPVDPSKKVYPRHHTDDEIKEARKRYLQRKIAREGGSCG